MEVVEKIQLKGNLEVFTRKTNQDISAGLHQSKASYANAFEKSS